MCGLAGIFSADRPNPALLARMADAVAHRGPDDQGVWVDDAAEIGFAHRRLAIIDLSPQGHQPMHSADGRFVISYNGEIYNHAELRAEIEARGAVPEGGWRGHSDTETLLQAIVVWGLESTLTRAAGMFAFSLWDRSKRVLQLVRDRFGEKPLYYGWAGSDFVFASELKALRHHPGFDSTINRRALKTFAARTYIPAPLSIYERVFKLEPGCVSTVTAEAARRRLDRPPQSGETAVGLRLSRYWSYSEVMRRGLEQPIAEEREALGELDRALGSAIRRQSIADVPVGAFLSGGIDSSTVVALYRKHSPGSVRTFSIGFEEADYNEADHARAVAKRLETVHEEHIITAREARDAIPLLPTIYDEPFANSSQIPTYLVSRFARQHVTVALTGDGGDELFAGYHRHFQAPRLWNHLQRVPRPLRVVAAETLGRIPSGVWQRMAALLPGGHQPHVVRKFQKALALAGSARTFDDVYLGFLDDWNGQSPVLNASTMGSTVAVDLDAGTPDALRVMYSDAVGYLPDDILCKVDRASMAVSLETRVPFLDHRVAEVAARIPMSMKVRDGHGKHIVRELLYRHAPRELFDRPKSGFAVPVGEWIKGPLRYWAEDLLDERRMAQEGWFDAAVVHRRWQQHLSGQTDSTPAIWSILMFQAWLREQKQELAAAA